ncbi:hypothetical protein NGRA_2242 [Nosema granulosis]|uniref:Uncharacterized protein n=1 Tax=Nosema granulosis TaxID=83296 RepID=A0A9P6GX16_9MICR|nr:hypothetical protein NGRA_2242 [Nosema granulosis]
MSKNVWFAISLIFSLALIAFVVYFYYMRNEEKTKTPTDLEKIFTKETYEEFKKFGIEQSDDTIKAILMSIYNISSVKSSYVEECVKGGELKNSRFSDDDKTKLTPLIVNFNDSLKTELFKADGLKNVLGSKEEKNINLINFFKNFKKEDNKVLTAEKALELDMNKFYKKIKDVFKLDFKADFEFTEKQKIVFDDKKYSVFDFVYQNFIYTYKGFTPEKTN